MPTMSTTGMRPTKVGGSPEGELARASRMRGSAMRSGCVRAGRLVSGGGELSQHLGPELRETAQTDTLPDAAEGVKVEGQVVDGHERGRAHLVRKMQVAEVGAAGR